MAFDAGETLTEGHFTETASDTQNDLFTFNSTTFGVDVDSGTYNDCGVAFLAPKSTSVLILFAADMANDGTGTTSVAPVVREGATVGAGTEVVAASLDNQIRFSAAANDAVRCGAHLFVTGLVAGNPYNVRLEHRVSGGISTMQRRSVTVMPTT